MSAILMLVSLGGVLYAVVGGAVRGAMNLNGCAWYYRRRAWWAAAWPLWIAAIVARLVLGPFVKIFKNVCDIVQWRLIRRRNRITRRHLGIEP